MTFFKEAQSSKSCTACELNVKCWDRQDDLVDGIIEYNQTVNADGCLQLSMICRMENESPLGFALLTIGEVRLMLTAHNRLLLVFDKWPRHGGMR